MFGWGKESFDASKTTAALKMAVTRMKLQMDKRTNSIKVQRRQIAESLRDEKFESARIKVEQVIRDEYYIEALELLKVCCEILCSRMMLVKESKNCPVDLKEAVSTAIWCCPRTDGLDELVAIRKQFVLKFGKEFVEIANEDRERAVNQRVMEKLSCAVPDPNRCRAYLEDICNEYGNDWETVIRALGHTIIVEPTPSVDTVAPLPPPPPIPSNPYDPSLYPPPAPVGSSPAPQNAPPCDLNSRLDALRKQ
eukprot:TRINITY_DN511_c3_g1_i1.p1 TRINITY_DN511_c3_g1~~TRINITY_DN511_c3_g1_i1.p1  ORF type:complete len:269 (+),score=39.20 TRINITY_DN511_c3_g1_i1:57-809(+)